MTPLSARAQRVTICLLSLMPSVWAGRKHSVPESKDRWAGQIISYYQILFPVFPKNHLIGAYPFFPFSWTYILVLIFLSIQHNFLSLELVILTAEAGRKLRALSWHSASLPMTTSPWCVYCQVQHLSGHVLQVWNKNVFNNEAWLTLFEGQFFTQH